MSKTVLILAANPKNTPRLRLDQEIREISDGLQRAQKRDEFILKQRWAARPVDVRRDMLDHKPKIVHFCGHGEGEEGIVFEDEKGDTKLVSADALSEFFKLFSDKVECVFLNACYSAVQAEAIAQHIPYVIGMKKGIGDDAAIEFAVAFYDALGAGESIEFAFRLACNAIQWAGLPEHLTPMLKFKTHTSIGTSKLSEIKLEMARVDFYNYMTSLSVVSIDNDKRFKNLSKGYWVYDEFINTLISNGWTRFAVGFKAGIYAHQKHPWCIKVIGMGVGDNPSYFCERGYYLEHERNMLISFRSAGFDFQPDVMSQEESIEFLVGECGVTKEQAIARSTNNDILITEFLPGMPLLTQTGKRLESEINPLIMNDQVLFNIGIALESLKMQLDDANAQGFLHNDPIGFNIVLTLVRGKIIAKLVDFELAQNLNEKSPGYVNASVEELYKERNVPLNLQTGRHTKNLDQHLICESIQIVEQLSARLKNLRGPDAPFYSISSIGPFYSGIEIKLKNVIEYLRQG